MSTRVRAVEYFHVTVKARPGEAYRISTGAGALALSAPTSPAGRYTFRTLRPVWP